MADIIMSLYQLARQCVEYLYSYGHPFQKGCARSGKDAERDTKMHKGLKYLPYAIKPKHLGLQV